MPSFWDVVNHVLDEADVILEVLDARFPEETRNKEIENKVIRNNKKIIYVLNKSDLIREKFTDLNNDGIWDETRDTNDKYDEGKLRKALEKELADKETENKKFSQVTCELKQAYKDTIDFDKGEKQEQFDDIKQNKEQLERLFKQERDEQKDRTSYDRTKTEEGQIAQRAAQTRVKALDQAMSSYSMTQAVVTSLMSALGGPQVAISSGTLQAVNSFLRGNNMTPIEFSGIVTELTPVTCAARNWSRAGRTKASLPCMVSRSFTSRLSRTTGGASRRYWLR